MWMCERCIFKWKRMYTKSSLVRVVIMISQWSGGTYAQHTFVVVILLLLLMAYVHVWIPYNLIQRVQLLFFHFCARVYERYSTNRNNLRICEEIKVNLFNWKYILLYSIWICLTRENHGNLNYWNAIFWTHSEYLLNQILEHRTRKTALYIFLVICKKTFFKSTNFLRR